MDDNAMLNSSDVEFPEPVKLRTRASKKSIQDMIDHRFKDSIRTKKRTRTFADTKGAFGSVYICTFWISGFEYYVQINKMS
jgi:hypothetical protein